MITPNEIREKKLSVVDTQGYDRDEVNELLVDVIDSYESVYNENKELYRKMEILANRIEEYREEEDSIKKALVSAEKLATQVTAEAKEKAEQALSEGTATAQRTVVDAKEKAEKIISEAREYVASLTKEKEEAAGEIVSSAEQKANEAINSAKLVAQNVIDEAKALSSGIINKAKEESKFHQELSAKLKDESKGFRESLISLYESQLAKLRNLVVTDDSATDEEHIESLENQLNDVMSNIDDLAEAVVEDSNEEAADEQVNVQDEDSAAEETAEGFDEVIEDSEAEEEIEEIEELDEAEEIAEEQADDFDDEIEEVDNVVEEIGTLDNTYEQDSPDEEEITEEMVENAIDAFSSDEITPIDQTPSIPVIDEKPEMPFESYFNVNRNDAHNTDEVISLIPPEDDEDDEDADSGKFRGFFKKKK